MRSQRWHPWKLVSLASKPRWRARKILYQTFQRKSLYKEELPSSSGSCFLEKSIHSQLYEWCYNTVKLRHLDICLYARWDSRKTYVTTTYVYSCFSLNFISENVFLAYVLPNYFLSSDPIKAGSKPRSKAWNERKNISTTIISVVFDGNTLILTIQFAEEIKQVI